MALITRPTTGQDGPGPTPDPAEHPAHAGLAGLRLPGLVLLGLLALRTVLLFAGDGVIAAVARLAGHDAGGAMAYADVSVVAVDVVTLLVLVRVLRRRGRRLREALGTVRLRRDLLVALPVTLVLLVAFVVASYAANLAVYGGAPPAGAASRVPLWLGVWSITVMPVTVAVAEELLYRGVVLQALRSRFPAVVAVLVSSVFFGLQHAALSLGSPADMAARVLTTALCGIVFAVLALRLRRLLPLVVGHWVLDVLGLGLPMLYLALR